MNPVLVARLLASTAALALVAYTGSAGAQSPQSPTVAAGSIAVTRQGSATVVTQSTEKGVIDWRSFSIGPQEAVRFDQPGRSSVTLNRVTGSEISRIDGSLSANGQVWLANPNGVMIGPGGQVNVGGLLATTGRIDAQEFLRSGRALIDQVGRDAAIVNQGSVNISEGGYAALAAASIRNEGVVAARAGTIAVGAGKAMTVDFAGDKLIQYQVTQPLDQASSSGEAAIVSTGTLAARGGAVLLSARAAKGVMDNVVNLKGLVVSNSVRVEGGAVVFGDGGSVQVSAKIDASNAGGQGGSVAVLGEKVGLMDGAMIDASGSTGGGVVLVGGDWQGKGSVQNAKVAYVSPTARITVDATQSGDGGKAVVWADDTARVSGSISAQGGVLAGDGGMVETSGKQNLIVERSASVTTAARAATGKAGSWLLDPSNITITSGGTGSLGGGVFDPAGVSTIDPATIASGLSSGNVTLQTLNGTGGAGDILFTSGTISYAGGSARTLKLLADRNVDIQSGTAIVSTAAALNVILNAGATATTQNTVVGGIQVTNATISTLGGSIDLVGGLNGAFNARGYDPTGAAFTAGVSVAGAKLIAGAGAIKILGEASPNYNLSGGGGAYIVNQTSSSNASTVTAGGGITIVGIGAPISTDNSTGLIIGNFYDATPVVVQATGSGTLSVTGQRGSGGTSTNFALFTAGTLMTSSGDLMVNAGYAGGTGGSSVGLKLQTNALITTSTGTITITGAGAASGGGSNDGVHVGFGATTGSITATGATGAIVINGVRGAGSNSSNIYVQGASTISTLGGNIDILGTSNNGAGTQNYGVVLYNGATVQTATGALSIKGTGSSGGGSSNDGVNINTATVTATGGAGTILIGGVAGTGGLDIATTNGVFTTAGGVLAFEADATIGAATSSFNAGAGFIAFRPTNGGVSIGVNGGAGALQLSSGPSSNTFSSVVQLGRADLTAAITVGPGAQIANNTVLLTGGGGVSFAGALDGVSNGAQSLTINAPGGTITFGGNVGVTTPLASLTVQSGTVTNTSATSFTIKTTGTQSYAGALLLSGDGGSTAASFSAVNSNILFGGPINSIAGGQEQGLLFDAGAGTVSYTGAIGASTAMNYVSYAGTGPGKLITSGNILTIRNQNYAGSVVVGAATTFYANGWPIVFNGTIDGSFNVTVDTVQSNASATFNGIIGGTTPLASFQHNGGPTVFGLAATLIRTGGAQNYTNGSGSTNAITLTAPNTTFSTSNTPIFFAGPIDSVSAVSYAGMTLATGTGGISLGNSVGFTTPLATFSTIGTGPIRLGGYQTTTGTQSYGGAVILLGSPTFATNNANITFSGPVDANNPGVQTLAANLGAGTVSFVGGVGTTTALNTFSVLNAALSGAVITSGAQTYSNAYLLSNVTLSSNNNQIVFNSSIEGAGGLTLSAGTGAVQLGATVGSTTPLAFLNHVGSGIATAFNSVITAGTQSYAGPVVVAGTGLFSANNSAITFGGPVDAASAGTYGLIVSAGSGAVSFGNNFGLGTALASFNSIGAGTVSLAGTYVTTGSQSYVGAVRMTGATTFATTNALVGFTGAVDGPGAMTLVTGTGAAVFNSTIGATTPLALLNAAGSGVFRTGGAITTVGTQSYAGGVVLGANTVFQSNSAASDIVFTTLNGGFAATINAGASGTASFSGTVGGVTALASFTQLGASAISLANSVTTVGTQSYSSAIVLNAGTAFSTTNADLIFSGPVNANVVGQNLGTFVGAGTVSLTGGVGQTTALGVLSLSNAALSGAIRTTAAQSYGDAVILGATVLSTTNANVTFVSTLNGPGGLTVSNGTAPVQLALSVGATTSLAYFNQTGSGKVTVYNSLITAGTQSFAGAVEIAGLGNFSTSNNAITFGGPVDGAAITNGMTVSTGSGAINFGNNFGVATALASFTQLGTGIVTLVGQYVTQGTQAFTGQLNIAGPVSMTSNAGSLALGGGSTGSGSLTLNSAATLAGAFNTTGAQSYNNVVTLSGPTSFSAPGQTISFAGNISGGANPLSLSAGQVVLSASGASAVSANSLTVNAPIKLGYNTTITATNAIALNGAIEGTGAGLQSLTVTNGSSPLSFGGAIGASTPLASLNATTSSGLFINGNVTTSISQSYSGAVVLTNNVTLNSNDTIAFTGAVNSGGGARSLTVQVNNASAPILFSGGLGTGTALANLVVQTNGAAVSFPAVTAQSLSVTTANGAVGLTGAANVSGLTSLNAGSGAIGFSNAGNDLNQVNLTTTSGANISDSTGTLQITGASTGSLQITAAPGVSVTQTGSIAATALQIGGGGGYVLTGANNVGTLMGSGAGTISFTNGPSAGLTVGNLTAGAATITQSGSGYLNVAGTLASSGAVALTAGGNLDVNGALNANSASFATAGTLSGAGTISVTSSPLMISANGGSITPTVAGVSGPAVASATYINVSAGSITVNGTTLAATSATVATVASVPTVPTTPTVATVATVATIPTVATVPTVASVPTVAPTVASIASIASTPTLPTTPIAPTSLDAAAKTAGVNLNADTSVTPVNGDSRDVTIGKILMPPIVVPPPPLPPPPPPPPAPPIVSAANSLRIVSNTVSGALIPPGPPIVAGTNTPLASTPTIKVDAIDTGGANGQVIAASGGPGGGGNKPVVPGLVSEGRAAGPAARVAEPPLAQQPSQMNEEPFLD